MAELHFFTGTMDSGKSTLALQTNHNHAARGRAGRIFTSHDRAGQALVSSRLGLTHDALEVDEDFDFWRYVVDELTHGARIDYLICDEAQFYTGLQVEQLAKVVDELQIDTFAFGILSERHVCLDLHGLRRGSGSAELTGQGHGVAGRVGRTDELLGRLLEDIDLERDLVLVVSPVSPVGPDQLVVAAAAGAGAAATGTSPGTPEARSSAQVWVR